MTNIVDIFRRQQNNALFAPSDPLQNALVDRFRTQGGFIGEQGVTNAQALQGGGVLSQASQQPGQAPAQQPVSTPQNSLPNIVNPQPAQSANQGFSGIQQSVSQAFTPLGSNQTSAGPAPVANPVAQKSPLQNALFKKFPAGTGVTSRLPGAVFSAGF